MNMFAAVGNDGTRPVVWGLGSTEEEALADARRELGELEGEADHELDCHAISEEQAATVRAGHVGWPVPNEGGDT